MIRVMRIFLSVQLAFGYPMYAQTPSVQVYEVTLPKTLVNLPPSAIGTDYLIEWGGRNIYVTFKGYVENSVSKQSQPFFQENPNRTAPQDVEVAADGGNAAGSTQGSADGRAFVGGILLNIVSKELGLSMGTQAQNFAIINSQIIEIEYSIQNSTLSSNDLTARATQIAGGGLTIPRIDLGEQNVLTPGAVNLKKADLSTMSARKLGKVVTFNSSPELVSDYANKTLQRNLRNKEFDSLSLENAELTHLASTGQLKGTSLEGAFEDGVLQVKDSGLAESEGPYDGAEFKTDPLTPQGQLVRRVANRAQLAWAKAKYRGSDLATSSSTFLQSMALLNIADSRLSQLADLMPAQESQAYAMAYMAEKVVGAMVGFERGFEARLVSISKDIQSIPDLGKQIYDWGYSVARNPGDAIQKGWTVLRNTPEYTAAVYEKAASAYDRIQELTLEETTQAMSEAWDKLTVENVSEFVGELAVDSLVTVATGGLFNAARAARVAGSVGKTISIAQEGLASAKAKVGNLLKAGGRAGVNSKKDLHDLSKLASSGATSAQHVENRITSLSTSRHYSPEHPGPHDIRVAESFMGARYFDNVLGEGEKFYRVYGGESPELGPYFSRTKPISSITAKRTLSLPPYNDADEWIEITIPRGKSLRVLESFAAPKFGQPGGGHQIYSFDRINESWITGRGKLNE